MRNSGSRGDLPMAMEYLIKYNVLFYCISNPPKFFIITYYALMTILSIVS